MFPHTASSILLTLTSVSLIARAQLAGQTVLLSTVLTGGADGGNGNCLTATQNADGAAVILEECGTNATQLNSWVVPNGVSAVGTLQIFGDKCLDVTNGVDADGTKLQIWTCATGNTNQMWVPSGTDSVITWSGKNKCIDLTNGNTTDGNQIQVWDCDPQNDNQKWIVKAVTQPKTRTIAWKSSNDRCITASSNTAGSPVVIGICDPGEPAQTFFDPFGKNQLGVYDNMCVTPAGDNALGQGVKLKLQACDATKQDQSWSFGQTTISNLASFGKSCIDLANGNKTEGNQLQLWGCAEFDPTIPSGDNANQDWIESFTF